MFATPARYQSAVRTAAVAAGALGVPGAFSFGLDLGGITAIWATMTLSIARESGHEMDRAYAAKFTSAVAAGVAGYLGGSKIATTLLHLLPGVGTATAVGVNSVLNALYTWRLGCTVAELFDKPDFELRDAGALALHVLRVMGPVPTVREAVGVARLLRGGIGAVADHF